jgi:uncharacterized repeat protein (TIGR01451 family)
MKKFSTLFALGIIGLFNSAFGQVTAYYPYADSIPGCGQNTLVVYVQGGTNAETGGILSIDWGDGSTGTENFTLSAGNSWTSLTINHSFATPGTYSVQTSVYSSTNGANVDAGQTNPMTAIDPSFCGYLYTGVYQNTPSYTYMYAPIDFTDVNGVVTTINTSQGVGNSYYQGLNPANVPYTVSVNDAWLATNGLVQITPDGTISSFNAGGMADISQYYFAVSCAIGAVNPDFGISYSWPSNFVAPLQTGTLYVDVCNFACSNTGNATVTIEMPTDFVPVTTGLFNPVIAGTTLTFEVLGLTDCALLQIPFTFPGTVTAGTQICFDITVSSTTDTDPMNNNESICAYVLNSYDPNAKRVDQPQYIDPLTQETLTYMVEFQNEGNYNAVNVVVKDTLDANLDLSSFQFLGSKHGVAMSLDPISRVVTFSFSNINLSPSSQDVDASKGFILYSVKENAGLPLGTVFNNTAYIYFDFNPAIVTNTTTNINSALSVNNYEHETLSMYPNPAQSFIQFNGGTVESIQLVDLTGKTVLSEHSVTANGLAIQALNNGLYQAIVTTKQGTHYFKLVVKK